MCPIRQRTWTWFRIVATTTLYRILRPIMMLLRYHRTVRIIEAVLVSDLATTQASVRATNTTLVIAVTMRPNLEHRMALSTVRTTVVVTRYNARCILIIRTATLTWTLFPIAATITLCLTQRDSSSWFLVLGAWCRLCISGCAGKLVPLRAAHAANYKTFPPLRRRGQLAVGIKSGS